MNEIICPRCQNSFNIDEAGYADILRQVRNQEFDQELKNREAFLIKEKESTIAIIEERAKNTLAALSREKDNELLLLKTNKDKDLADLKARLTSFETEKALAVSEALSNIKQERDRLSFELENEKNNKKSEIQNLEVSFQNKLVEEKRLKEAELKAKDELIERYKDMKAKLSTKMLGETLEKHCEIEFNKIRQAAFPNVYFQKDNDISTGTKGDYVFREKDSEGNEIISIMFEMKNEADDTTNKKKNEDFLKKLDEDRKKKNCEYAVLVTMLEADNELYSTGIVDVSYLYPKMYVIRPQFFIPMITLLRNAALNTMDYKAQLNQVKNQNIDITNFEVKITEFKDGFDYNRRLAVTKFETAIADIEKSIKYLTQVKDNLQGSINQMRLAADKLDDLTIKKLTRGNPTMKAKFEKENGNDEKEVIDLSA